MDSTKRLPESWLAANPRGRDAGFSAQRSVGESLVAQLDSTVNHAEQFRDQQVQQRCSDRWAFTSKKRLSESIARCFEAELGTGVSNAADNLGVDRIEVDMINFSGALFASVDNRLMSRLQSSLAATLASEQAQLQAIQQRAPSWTAG